MKRTPPAWLIMWLIAMSAAFLLGTTNEATSEMIKQRGLQEKEAARTAVFPDAQTFAPIDLEQESGKLSECYAAQKSGKTVGYVCTVNEQGYGGPIQVIVGLRPNGEVLGITVGGDKFSETAGLGAKTKDGAFTSQFAGKQAPLTLKMDIDAVTGA